ncbi:MAG: calcium-binding protein [Pseudomonadota bacterium]|nr:calcium-binding protein [Pseudomonadota bacterium]
MAKIELRSKYAPASDAEHLYLVYTDDNGNQFQLRAGPEVKYGGNDPFLSVAVYNGGHDLNSPDWDNNSLETPRKTVYEGSETDLDAIWAAMQTRAAEIDNADYIYGTFTQNSNTSVKEMIEAGDAYISANSTSLTTQDSFDGNGDLILPQRNGVEVDAPAVNNEFSSTFTIEDSISDLVNGLTDRITDWTHEQAEEFIQWVHDIIPTAQDFADFINSLDSRIASIGNYKFIEDMQNGFPELLTSLRQALGEAQSLASPIVLDLDGDGVTTTGLSGSSAFFDLDSNGFSTQTGWVDASDGLLAIDLNSNGEIDKSTELFSVDGVNNTIDIDAYDTNFDGKLNASDTDWANIKIWVDANGNGFTEDGELQSLGDLDITELDLGFTTTDTTQNGNWIGYTGTFTMDGSSHNMADVWFSHDTANSHYVGDFTMDWDTLSLPTLRGYGVVADLHIAMSMDSTLKTMVENLVSNAETNGSYNKSDFTDMLYQWAGVIDIAVDSRGRHIDDARMLEFIEKFSNEPFLQNGTGSNPLSQASSKLEIIFTYLLETFIVKFESQTINTDLTYNIFNDSITNENGVEYEGFILKGSISGLAHPIEVSNDTFLGDATDEAFSGLGGDDIFVAKEGDDTLHGGDGNDTYYFSAGDGCDTIYDKSGNDQIIFDDSVSKNDISFNRIDSGGQKNLIIQNTATLDSITIENYFYYNSEYNVESINVNGTIYNPTDILNIVSTFDGTQNDDSLTGWVDYDDRLSGLEGNDDISGLGGNDAIIGGTGDDLLEGGAGNDTYYFSTGDGNDIIKESSGVDAIVFDSSVSVSDINYRMEGIYSNYTYTWYNHLIIENIATGDTIKVDKWFNDTSKYAIEEIRFDDSTVHTINDIATFITTHTGDASANTLEGSDNTHNTLNGLAGNDTLTGKSGNDILTGDTGNDTLNGGAGNDTYHFALGDGIDTITDTSGVDKIIFASGIDKTDITLSQSTNDLVISITGGDQITISNWFSSDDNKVETFEFSSGFYFNSEHVGIILDNSGVIPTNFAPLIEDNTVEGGDNATSFELQITAPVDLENDTLTITVTSVPSATNGTVTLADGTTTVSVNDTLTVSELQGLLFVPISGQTGTFTFDYSVNDGTTTSTASTDITVYSLNAITGTSAAETLAGSTTHDYIEGLAGNDTLNGSYGDDIYHFSAGDGNDIINEYGSQGNDSILFDNTIARTDIKYVRGGYKNRDLTIENISTGDSITIDNYFHSAQQYNVENIIYHDGTLHDSTDILAAVAQQTGTANAETLSGFEYDDTLSGLGGNDILNGGFGNDNLTGGTGNDTLNGSYGDDLYHFSAGDGNDIINEYASQGNDSILFDNTISQADINYVRGGYQNRDLIIENTSTGDSITIDNYFHSAQQYNVENIIYQDGTTHDSTDIISSISQQTGTANGETLSGFEYNDTLYGLGGNDTLNGGGGNDTLVGGDGNDDLWSGTGDDYLQGDDGDDFLYGNYGNDILEGGAGSDTLNGSYDNDTLIYDANDARIDGDTGLDKLIVASNGSATSIDLGQSNLYQLETLDMRDGDADDSISLDVNEILSVSDTDIFTVLGDLGDDVTSNDTWTRGTDTTIDGKDFATYTSSTASLNIMLGLNFNSVEVEAL